MSCVCFWFRRDLRLYDNHGLYQALKSGKRVLPVFIFDQNILERLHNPEDKRVTFIYDVLQELNADLQKYDSGLLIKYGKPEEVWPELIEKFKVSAIYANHDYEPYARDRDGRINELTQQKGVDFFTFKDQVIFETSEVIKTDGTPYTVFTPYKNKWLSLFSDSMTEPYPSEKLHTAYYALPFLENCTLEEIGFRRAGGGIPERKLPVNIIREYDTQRDYPSIRGTSRMSVHLRFGTLSVRKAVAAGRKLNQVWLSELIWREFYMMILWHFPYVTGAAFKPAYDQIEWLNNPDHFKAWCEGKTGYPIVDAGMRELNETGFMHNRVRMIVASFLTKHLLIDWRWGEAWFAEKLLDFDLAANNGGWQWAAGSGCDAAPYFRVFSPEAQTLKFDPKAEYIRKWVPEFGTASYPRPMVDHGMARLRAVETYKKGLNR